MNTTHHTVAVALLAAAVAPAAAQFPIDTVAVDSVMRAEMVATGAPGAAIAIIVDGDVVFERGLGVRSVESGEAVTPTTLFRIGSVTKAVTALAALCLRADDALDLDAPLSTVLPELHPALGERTMQQLLTHMAGVIALPSAHGPHDDGALLRRMLEWTDTVLFAEADDVYSYSSPGYWLAGAVVEQVTGMAYADAVDSLVFEPLGMTRSTLRPLEAFTWPTALDHRRADGRIIVARPYPDDASTWPGGSVFSSAEELSRLALALLDDGRLDGEERIPAAAVLTMHQPQAPSPDGDCAYTYGLSRCGSGDDVTLSHYGFRSGSGAVFTLVPARRAAIVVLANGAGAIFGRTEAAVLDMLGVERGGGTAPSARLANDLEVRELVGSYVAGADTLRIIADADGLQLHARGSSYPVRVDEAEADRILLLDAAGRIVQTFRLVDGARTDAVYLHDGLNAFRRVVVSYSRSVTPASTPAARRAGTALAAIALAPSTTRTPTIVIGSTRPTP